MANRKSLYRDKKKASRTLMAQKLRYARRTGAFTAPRYHQRWEATEEGLVMESVLSDRELSERIGRSVQAIQVHRSELLKRDRNG